MADTSKHSKRNSQRQNELAELTIPDYEPTPGEILTVWINPDYDSINVIPAQNAVQANQAWQSLIDENLEAYQFKADKNGVTKRIKSNKRNVTK